MRETQQRLAGRLGLAGIGLPGGQLEQLVDYLELLAAWNRRMNLTSLADPDLAIDRLVVEPVLAAAAIDDSATSLMDIGSGGGSPAVPIKVVRPDLALTMVEVKAKKSVFLREVTRRLLLKNVAVETTRFKELLGRPEAAATRDVISIRAVRAEAADIAMFSSALTPRGQQLWFLSGAQTSPEMPAGVRLLVERELPLVDALKSRLLVLRKAM